GRAEPLDVPALQRALGPDTALVEYASLDGELFAFVVTEEGVEVVRGLASEAEVGAALAGFRFQADAMRHGAARVRAHMGVLTARARHYLAALYDMLLRPVEEHVGKGEGRDGREARGSRAERGSREEGRADEREGGAGRRRLVVVPHRALH